MAKVSCSSEEKLKTIAEYYIHLIEQVDFQNVNNDVWVSLESYCALYQLRALLRKIINHNYQLNLTCFRLFEKLFESRWQIIEDTDCDYINNDKTSANQIYIPLSKIITEKANNSGVCKKNYLDLLIPEQHFVYEPIDNRDKLRNFIYDTLYNKKDDKSAQLISILKKLKITEKEFSKEMILELLKVRSDLNTQSAASLDTVLSYLDMNAKLTSLSTSEQLITISTIKPFINWFEKRWTVIDKSMFNDFAKSLANFIVLTSYQTGFVDKDPKKLMMEFNRTKNIITDKASEKNICNQIKTREVLINVMLHLLPSQWQKFMDCFDCNKLIKLITNNDLIDNIPKFFEENEEKLFTNCEKYNKALLFVLFDIYEKKRQTGTRYDSLFGKAFSYIVFVPDKLQKINIVQHIKSTYLSGDLSLAQFSADLQDVNSILNKNLKILQNGKLRAYVNQIEIANEAREKNANENRPKYIL